MKAVLYRCPLSSTQEIAVFPGMSADEGALLFERIGATAIANQAILKCTVAGVPLTVDNVILFVGDFVDPEQPAALGLIERINSAIEEVIDCRGLMARLSSIAPDAANDD